MGKWYAYQMDPILFGIFKIGVMMEEHQLWQQPVDRIPRDLSPTTTSVKFKWPIPIPSSPLPKKLRIWDGLLREKMNGFYWS